MELKTPFCNTQLHGLSQKSVLLKGKKLSRTSRPSCSFHVNFVINVAHKTKLTENLKPQLNKKSNRLSLAEDLFPKNNTKM